MITAPAAPGLISNRGKLGAGEGLGENCVQSGGMKSDLFDVAAIGSLWSVPEQNEEKNWDAIRRRL